jgi:hypothetical protein
MKLFGKPNGRDAVEAAIKAALPSKYTSIEVLTKPSGERDLAEVTTKRVPPLVEESISIMRACMSCTPSAAVGPRFALNGAMLSRYRTAYRQEHWRADDRSSHLEFKNNLEFLDKVMPKLAGIVDELWPNHLKSWVLPDGVPAEGKAQALGVLKDRVIIHGIVRGIPPTIPNRADKAVAEREAQTWNAIQ